MKLKTLGGLALQGSTFHRPKPLLLLAYLAVEGPTTRRVLADTFFARAKKPRDSLSTALRYLRYEDADLVQSDGDTIRTNVTCDATELVKLLDAGDAEQVMASYGGAFLRGLDVELGPELEEWVFGTREALADQVQDVHLRAAESTAAQGDFVLAARDAESAYFLPGAPEPTPERLQRIHTVLLAGDSTRERDVREEAESFGVVLVASGDEAREKLRDGASVASSSGSEGVPNNLPRAEASFVGRDLELSEAANLLDAAEVRLLSLIGAGGVGKSRLAVEIARAQVRDGSFPDGVHFVKLDSIQDPAFVAAAIADAMSIALQGADPAHDQVLRNIGDKRLLLVLDNFEQLVEGVAFVSDLLAACPKLKLVITSRERLNIREEWLFPVEGLAYPPDEGSLGEAHHYEAMKMFELRAKHHQRTFRLTPATSPGTYRICRLVEGMPLGLELAATWVRHMPVDEIASELERGIDVLAASARDAPERHASLRATFEHSWKLLSEREREVLRRLSVFRGGFRREAASSVVEVTLPMLARLVDKSLLRVSPNGRYDRHPLLHQCMEEKLGEVPGERDEFRSRHSRYYLDLLVAQDDALTGGSGIRAAAELIEEELPNLRVAWGVAIDQARLDVLEHALLALVQFAELRSQYREVAGFTERVFERLDPDDPNHVRMTGLTHAIMAMVKHRVGNNSLAIASALEATRLLEPLPLGSRNMGLWLGWFIAGVCTWTLGRASEAWGYHLRALEIAEFDLAAQADDRRNSKHAKMRLGLVFHNLGLISFYGGTDYAEAETFLKKAITTYAEIEAPYVTYGYLYLGQLYLSQGRVIEGRDTLEEGLAIARSVNFTTSVSHISCLLAKAHLLGGDREAAIRFSDAVAHTIRASGDKWSEATLHTVRGWIALDRVRNDEAKRSFVAAIEAAVSVKAYTFGMEAVFGLATTLAEVGESVKSIEVLAILLQQPGTPEDLRSRSAALLEELTANVGGDAVEGVMAKSATAEFQDVLRVMEIGNAA